MLSGSLVARHYQVTEATVRRWRRDGMPAHWYNAKLVRYRLSEVEAWLAAKGAQPRPAIIPPHKRKEMEEEANAAQAAEVAQTEEVK